MKTKKGYKTNLLLIVVAVLTLASAILITVLHGANFHLPNRTWIAIHATLGLAMGALVFSHLKFNWSNILLWFARFKMCRNKVTKALFILSFFAFVSGIVAIFTFFTGGHGPVGGIHGKIGLVFLLICIGHFIKRIKWYR